MNTHSAGRAPRGRKGNNRPQVNRRARLRGRRADICPVTGKVRWRDHEEAIQALHVAMNAKATARSYGVESRRNECRVYVCPACRRWHLTSWMTASGFGLTT